MRLLGSQRVRILLIFIAVWLLLAAGFRAGLLIACRQYLDDRVSGWQLAKCLLVGARFDGSVLGWVALPLASMLAAAPARAFASRWFRRAVSGYVAIVLAVAIFVKVVEVYYFLQYMTQMDWNAVDFLKSPGEVLGYIWGRYPVTPVVAGTVLLLAGLHWTLMKVSWRGARPAGSIGQRLALAGGLIGGCLLAIRGGLLEPLTVQAAAGVSGNNVVRQLTLNGPFSLAATLAAPRRKFAPPPAEEVARVTTAMLYQPHDTPLHAPGNPLWRRTDTGRPRADHNVVLIIMESMATSGVGALGHSPSYTPNLDQLSRAGLFFDRVYAAGMRTRFGIVASVCGYPDITGDSVMSDPRAQGCFLTLPGLLKGRGYRTLFVYGGNGEWFNLEGFFQQAGLDDFIGQAAADPHGGNSWGDDDEVTFGKLHKRLVEYSRRGEKFFAAIMTISNHEPFSVPPGRIDLLPTEGHPQNRRWNAQRYSDWAIGDFFRMAREADYFKDTIFVLVADHGREFNPVHAIDVPGFRLPLIVYAPGLVPPGRCSTVGSQTDIPPTVLSLLGGQFDHCFIGRDLQAVGANAAFGFAMLCNGDKLGFVRGDRAVLVEPFMKPRYYRVGDAVQDELPADRAARENPELWSQLLCLYTMTFDLYEYSRYCPPASCPAVPRPPGK